MSPDIPLKIVEWFFQFGLIGFLLGMMALYAIFRGWYYIKLLSEDSGKESIVFNEVKTLIQREHWGDLYRSFLGKFLGKLTNVIGDYYRFPHEYPKKPRIRAGDPIIWEIHKKDGLSQIFGVNPFTSESYKFCLLIAYYFPMLVFVLGWVISGNGTLGYLVILSSDTQIFERFLVFLLFFASIIIATKSRDLTGWKFFIVFSLTTAFAVFAALAGGASVFVIVAIALSVMGFVTIAGAVSGVFMVAFAGSFPWYIWCFLTLVIIILSDFLFKKIRGWYLFFSGIVILVGSILAISFFQDREVVIVLLLYVILPIIKSPIDWLSLGGMRALLQSTRFNHHRFFKTISWAIIDLFFAFIAFIFFSLFYLWMVSIINMVMSEPVIDLKSFLNSLGNYENWQDNLWGYLLLLSIFTPSILHFAFAGGALTLSVSAKERNAIIHSMDESSLGVKKAWIYVSVLPAVGFVLAPTLLIFGLYGVLLAYGPYLVNELLPWIELHLMLVDSTLGQFRK